jgi:tetratricopeptide (TPR) repeat protein
MSIVVAKRSYATFAEADEETLKKELAERAAGEKAEADARMLQEQERAARAKEEAGKVEHEAARGTMPQKAVLRAAIGGMSSRTDIRFRAMLRRSVDLASLTAEQYRGLVRRTGPDSITVFFDSAGEGFKAAVKIRQEITRYDRERNDTGQHIEPRVAIHYGEASGGESRFAGPGFHILEKVFASTGKNEICLSGAFYRAIKDDFKETAFIPLSLDNRDDKDGEFRNYRVLWDETTPVDPGSGVESQRFTCHGMLREGPFHPCFYCGSKRHGNADCPSRFYHRLSGGVSDIGYYSIATVNSLFRQYAERIQTRMMPEDNGDRDERLIARSFFDLKRPFQLRMLSILWDNVSSSWDAARDSDSRIRGGALWLAHDCLRTSRLAEAEKILTGATSIESGDYRALCALGFLAVDREDLYAAEGFFRKALAGVRTKPQRIFVLFLLFRTLQTRGEPTRAQERLRDILRLDPYCKDALYFDLVLKLKRGQTKDTFYHLRKLVERAKEYYMIAMIDPEMEEFAKDVIPELYSLFLEAKEAAQAGLYDVEGRFPAIARWAGSRRDSIEEIEKGIRNIRGLMESNSYYGYLEAAQHTGFVGALITELKQECLAVVAENVREVQAVLNALSLRAGGYPENGDAIFARIRILDNELKSRHANALGEASLEDTIAGIRAISETTAGIERQVRKLERRTCIAKLFLACFKKAAICFIVAAVIGFTALPVLFLFAQNLPGIGDLTRVLDQRSIQKWVVILGTTVGAAVTMIRQLVGRD